MTPPCKSEDFTARVVPDEHPITLVGAKESVDAQQRSLNRSSLPSEAPQRRRTVIRSLPPGALGREQVEGLGQDLVDGDIGHERGVVG
jgi:hypothetical protein